MEQYRRMIQEGLLDEDNSVELLEGVLVRKMSKYPDQVNGLDCVEERFRGIFPRPQWVVRMQNPIPLSDSEPEPDLVVANGPRSLYRERHPSPDDVLIVVEVVDSSVDRDKSWKRRIYANAGIALYWVVDV